MSAELNRKLALQTLERAFNQGDVSVFDEVIPARAVDHQEAPGTDMLSHLKEVVPMMRRAFPDLHFEVHHVLAEGDIVAFHSTMTGTHLGVYDIGPFRNLPPTGRRIKMRHMHFLRWQDGKNTDLWHLMDTASLMRQLTAPESAAPPVNS